MDRHVLTIKVCAPCQYGQWEEGEGETSRGLGVGCSWKACTVRLVMPGGGPICEVPGISQSSGCGLGPGCV